MKQKHLIINPIGGLANRMRAIASGVALGQATGLPVRVLWPVDSDLKAEFGSLFVATDKTPPTQNTSSLYRLLLCDDPRRRNLYLSKFTRPFRYATRLMDTTNLYALADNPDKIKEIVEDATGDILVQSGIEFFPFDRDSYRQMWQVKPELLTKAKGRLKGCNVIGIHIRRTDNVLSIRHSPLELFIEAMEKEITEDSNVSFYLASDDKEVKETLATHFGDSLIFSSTPVRRDTSQGMEDAVVDLVALSLCKKIYGSYWSSFSEAAAILGDIPLYQLNNIQK